MTQEIILMMLHDQIKEMDNVEYFDSISKLN